MPKIRYTEYRPNTAARALIDICNDILESYKAQGYQLTLRQLYYQLVARDHIPNNQKSYNRVGDVVSRAREGGLIDWDYIEDRTRELRTMPHWEDGSHFLTSVAPQFNLDLWQGQEIRVVVFVEKEALGQIVEKACRPYDVPYLSNKGYLSASAAWSVGHDHMLLHPECNRWVILHLGDHDPSGIDMTRDIQQRLLLFSRQHNKKQDFQYVDVERIALTMDQIDEYNPPPNPAKTTDSRFAKYLEEYGDESWELDALQPQVIHELIQSRITDHLDPDLFEERQQEQEDIRERLIEAAESF